MLWEDRWADVCLPACSLNRCLSANNNSRWPQLNKAVTVRIVTCKKQSQVSLTSLSPKRETLGLMLINMIAIIIKEKTRLRPLHQLIGLRRGQRWSWRRRWNLRLRWTFSSITRAAQRSVPPEPPLSLQLKHWAVERLCSWLVISKRGHGVPSPAEISEAHPHTHNRMRGNLLKGAMEGLLYVNKAFCLKGHI